MRAVFLRNRRWQLKVIMAALAIARGHGCPNATAEL
jgi:hypothetical protein